MLLKICDKSRFSRNKFKLKLLRKYCNNQQNFQATVPDLEDGYKPHRLEGIKLDETYFKAKTTTRETFSLILPPPNITGSLHLGHALTATVQDILVRWKRMQGIKTVWIPGIDHAGIATQVVVEKRLWKENHQTRHEVGREHFQEQVWKWKREKADIIGDQLRRLDVALDWSREVFTMDAVRSKAVIEAFVRLFDAGLIYRSDYLVNWSCVLQSAISDVEVEHLEVDRATKIVVPGYEKRVDFGYLYHFAYKFVDSDEEIVVATTRPETIFGDVAVAVNPRDDRYIRHIGRNLWHPFRKQTIPIICDDFVDPDFGTGAVKITPAHDHIDFECGKRHKLPTLEVINEKGNLTDNNNTCGEFAGIRRFDARNIIVNELNRLQLLRGRQDHRMIIPICSRSKDVIEFIVKPQWFVKCSQMAKRAVDDVKEGRLAIHPKHFDKIWFNWLENIRDWCISRQLWWGHRIPIYFCHIKDQLDANVWIAADNLESVRCKAASNLATTVDNIVVKQDEDVLDTWFSSALQPFSAFGWPQQSSDLSQFYPLNLMETGHDILFFWVARMVMLGTQLTGKLPFDKIVLHGIVCDAHGRKMSKSLGNALAPEHVITGTSLLELEETSKANYQAGILSLEEMKRAIQGQKKMFPQGIPECGIDALRFTLVSHNIKSEFINFDVQECYQNKLFCNKIWQSVKFTNIWIKQVSERQKLKHIDNLFELSLVDRWILSRLTYMVEVVNKSLDNYDFYLATAALKEFLYYEFCDVYLETTKRGLRETDSEIAAGHCWTLSTALDAGLRALAPFMPRLAQHLHQHLLQFPEQDSRKNWRDVNLEKQIESVLNVVVGLRRLKSVFNVTKKHKPEAYIVGNLSLYGEFSQVIGDLAACHEVNVIRSQDDKASLMESAAGLVQDSLGKDTRIYLKVPEELIKNVLQLDLGKFEVKKGKLLKEMEQINKIVSDVNYKSRTRKGEQEAHLKKIAMLEEKLARINYIQNLTKHQQ